jgi:hypothetical protein
MIKAYRVVFHCPKGHSINLQRKCSKSSLSTSEAMELFGNQQISCEHARCGWRGKASAAKVIQVLAFNWVLSPVA